MGVTSQLQESGKFSKWWSLYRSDLLKWVLGTLWLKVCASKRLYSSPAPCRISSQRFWTVLCDSNVCMKEGMAIAKNLSRTESIFIHSFIFYWISTMCQAPHCMLEKQNKYNKICSLWHQEPIAHKAHLWWVLQRLSACLRRSSQTQNSKPEKHLNDTCQCLLSFFSV